MGKRVRLKEGDIFTFSLDAGRLGMGQIIEPGVVFYITVFREPAPTNFTVADIRTDDILLCGRTTDALFFHDRWHVVGNLPVPEEVIPRPCSKVEQSGKRWISDFHGRRLLRRATAREWDQLDYHKSISPITFERAFRAHHGLEPDEPHYARLSVDHARSQVSICESGHGEQSLFRSVFSIWRRPAER
ncbi:MAG TPA: Imm26 family immunity protein [Allosphingosinicella sp.]|nr:Imm26 family immunity protein [Allosphingosinicella sp.]